MSKELKITGKGNLKFKPDLTVIKLDFTKVEKEYENAIKKSSEDIRTVKEMLEELGLKKDKLKTLAFNIKPEYESYEDEKGKYQSRFIGYKYNQSLRFDFDISNETLGKVLYAISKLKINPKFDIFYTIKDIEKAKNKVLDAAIKDACSKAKIIAKASNTILGDILRIDYSDRSYDDDFDTINYCKRNVAFSDNIYGSADCFDIDIEPDDIDANDTVTITYELK